MLSLLKRYKTELRKIFLKDVKNWRYWITLAIIIKVLFAIFIFSQRIPPAQEAKIYACGGDTSIYLAPIDNLIEKGEYSPDYRMPGYGAPYFILRQLFSQNTARNLLVVMQLFLSGISVYALAMSAMYIFNSKGLFYWVFYTYLFSTYTSVFDIYLLADSLAVSTLIFATFWFVKGLERPDYKSFILTGLFLTWCIFLKPVSSPLAGLFMAILAINYMRNPNRKELKFNLAKAAFLFLLPLIVFDGAWVARNYKIYGRIIPLQSKTDYPSLQNDKVYVGLQHFLGAFGGDYIWWNPKAEICWFGYMEAVGNVERQIKDIKFPRYIYTSRFDYKDLEDIKNYIALSKAQNIPEGERIKYRKLSAEKLEEYANSIRKEKPYIYYICAPVRVLKAFLIHSGTHNLFNKVAAELNIFELGFKFLMSILYLFIVVIGFPGSIYLVFKNGVFNARSVMAIMAIYLTLVYPFGFRKCEYRYFTQAYPFMMVCVLYLTGSLYESIVEKYLKRRS